MPINSIDTEEKFLGYFFTGKTFTGKPKYLFLPWSQQGGRFFTYGYGDNLARLYWKTKGVKTVYMFILPSKLAEEMGTDKRRTKNSPYPFNKTIPQKAPKSSPFLRQKP